MDINELKPDFERISKILFSSNSIKDWDEEWNKIMNENELGYIKYSQGLEDILKDYHLLEFKSDFLFLLYKLKIYKEVNERAFLNNENYHTRDKEVKMALKVLYEDLNPKIYIQPSKSNKPNIVIQDQELILLLKRVFLLEFMAKGIFNTEEKVNIENIETWEESIILWLSHSQFYEIRKGRKVKHINTGTLIFFIAKYLQEFTVIKSEDVYQITRKQAVFIFDIMKCFELIDISEVWKEDNIRHIYNKYLKKVYGPTGKPNYGSHPIESQ